MENNKENIRISFLGDLMCTIPMTQKAERSTGYDFTPVFENAKESLASSDYVVGNLETPLAGADCLYTYHPTEFNSPDEFALAANKIGISMFTTANNHALDRGLYGLRRTINVLDQFGIEHVGTQHGNDNNRTRYKTIGGLKFAFISYTYDTNSIWMNNKLKGEDLSCVNLFKEQDSFPYRGEGYKGNVLRRVMRSVIPDVIKDLVRDISKIDCGKPEDVSSERNIHYEDTLFTDIIKAKKESDFVFVCLHIGGQYNDKIGEYTEKIVSKCKEVGSHFVICNHPHCILPISIDVNGQLVAYALGNFCYTPHWGFYVDGKYSDYSIILHMDFSKNAKQLIDIRFSIVKSVETDTNTLVYNTYELFYSAKNGKYKTTLKKDIQGVLYRLFGLHFDTVDIKKEYCVRDFIKY